MLGHIGVFPNGTADLAPDPINPDWVTGGDPRASIATLAKSADERFVTAIWHCTAGAFRWHYSVDETIQVLSGGMELHLDSGEIRLCGPGDLVVFRAGTACNWVIKDHVRKLAVVREYPPSIIDLARRHASRVKRLLIPRSQKPQTPERLAA